MSLQNKIVKITADQISAISREASIRSGESGTVVWDEPGGDVIVEFTRAVPNGGMLLSDRQAWVPRGDVAIVK